MTDDTAMDNRPDVEVRGTVMLKVPRNTSDTNHEHFVTTEGQVRFSAHCRFCTETSFSPDPVTISTWAVDHTTSEAHKLCKAEHLEASGRGTGRRIENVPISNEMVDGNWVPPGADTSC